MAQLTIFNSKDTSHEIHFLQDGEPVNLSAASKFTVEFYSGYTDTTVSYSWNSTDNAANFDNTDIGTGIMVFNLTAAQTTLIGRGEYFMVILVTTVDHTTGLPWQDTKFDHKVEVV